MPGDPTPAAHAHALAIAREDLARDAALRAHQAREAATRRTGVDREYLLERARELERIAGRLRDASRGSRG